jgi:TM2 domain-containing membrane protein YozV
MPVSNFCPWCGVAYDGDARFCASCGRPRADLAVPGVPLPPPSAPRVAGWPTPPVGSPPPASAPGATKSRPVAIALALLLGGLGLHKFYLGKVGLGIVYLLFCWTYIPSLIGWIEGITYLGTSDEAWAIRHNQPATATSGAAIGCLWLLALVPLMGILAIVSLIFLGGQVKTILSAVGSSI